MAAMKTTVGRKAGVALLVSLTLADVHPFHKRPPSIT
jgi:hypothetical protein